MPVTFNPKGRQYVTVLSGIGGLYWNTAREQLKDKVPPGGSVWTFALIAELWAPCTRVSPIASAGRRRADLRSPPRPKARKRATSRPSS